MAYNNYSAFGGGHETSKYNEAMFQIQRLHDLWHKIELRANSGELIQWKWLLDSVWRELRADVERQKNKKLLMEQNDDLLVDIQNAKTKTQMYKALNERHEFLKVLQDIAGKGGSYRDETEDDFE